MSIAIFKHPGGARQDSETQGIACLRILVAFLVALIVLSLSVTAPFRKDAEPQSAQSYAAPPCAGRLRHQVRPSARL